MKKTYRFQIRKVNLLQIRKHIVFKYEKCGLYFFQNRNVTYFHNKRHAIRTNATLKFRRIFKRLAPSKEEILFENGIFFVF